MSPQPYQQARTYLNTPFHHQGRSKHAGLDCLGLLLAVADDLKLQSRAGGMLTDYDTTDYGLLPQHYHLEQHLNQHLYPVHSHAPSPNHIALFTFRHHPQHLAIIGHHQNHPTLIHTHSTAKKVVEHHLTHTWKKHLYKIFSISERESRRVEE